MLALSAFASRYFTASTLPRSNSVIPSAAKGSSHIRTNEDSVFAYTSGRLLYKSLLTCPLKLRYNEKQHIEDRYVSFDVVNLQRIAAESVSRERCVSIKKLAEGSFNRVFLLTIDDGQEAFAKIPFRNAIPARYLTANEPETRRQLLIVVEMPNFNARKLILLTGSDCNIVCESLHPSVEAGDRCRDRPWSMLRC
jgi:hypothetical protein